MVRAELSMANAPGIKGAGSGGLPGPADSRNGPAVSVIVPNFNHGGHLPECVDALLAQKRSPDEIIIIDDASTDDSLAVIRGLAKAEPRIRIIPNSVNLGVVACVNIGLRAARGDYVTFAAADDITDPDFLATAVENLQRFPQAALFCAEAAVIETDRAGGGESRRPPVRPSATERYFSPTETAGLLRTNDHFIVTLTAVYRRDLLLAAGGFDPTLGSTSDGYVARALALRHGFCFAPRVLAHWKVVSTGYSRKTAGDADAVERLIGQTLLRMAGDPVFPDWYPDVFDRRFRFATCRLALRQTAPAWDFVLRIGARTGRDRAALAFARRLPGPLARFASLAWLTMRLRPYPFAGLAKTAIQRRFEPYASNRQ